MTLGTLSGISYFADLTQADLKLLATKMRTCKYQSGKVICNQGERIDQLHIIVKGRVRVTFMYPNGRGLDFGILTIGSMFGELSILDGGVHSVSLIAADDTEVLLLSREDFQILARTVPATAIGLAKLLAKRLRSTLDKVEDLAFLDVKTRIIKRLVSLATARQDGHHTPNHVVLEIKHDELANMVGTTRESVTRTPGKYSRMGLLKTIPGKIEINKLSTLRRLLVESTSNNQRSAKSSLVKVLVEKDMIFR